MRALGRRLPRPRSLRGRLVLIAGLLATSAVLGCQLAGLTVLRGWLTDQVDGRLSHFKPPPQVYEAVADDKKLRMPRSENALPSDYRVFFYDGRGRLLSISLGTSSNPEPQLPQNEKDLNLTGGKPGTIPAEDGSAGADWRAVSYAGPDGMRAVVALPLDTVDGATTKLLWLSFGLGAAAAVGVVVLGNGAVRLGLRPLTRVERTAQHITEGALELNVPVTDRDTEVGRLGLALNTMLDRLRTALHRTENSEQQLRRFLADAGHELRTPLTAVQGFAELLLDEPDMTEDRRREAHELIARNADRMSRLVDDLFLLAKLGESASGAGTGSGSGTGASHDTGGTPAAHREPVDLLSLAADAIATTAIRHPRRAIALEPLAAPPRDRPARPPSTDPAADAESDLDVIEAPGDPHQLAQVLGNLLANACTHTPAEARIRVRVGAVRVPGPPLCVVEVADDGPGISPEEAPHVFERFYRATPFEPQDPPGATEAASRPEEPGSPEPEPQPEPGSGLGLAIASAIATAHGGRLELDNHPGEGCTFRLLLPDSTTAPKDDTDEAHHASRHP
ncbi:sensor histidine kinase [Streptomyces sp. NPDC057694]|uniref:sensor histidine kinase n=1 Tax=Streptomyces sp. NPDC057694 TaxID=3346216 RepID=UPI0036B60BA4